MNQPQIIRDELAFVLESDEQRFLTILRARLLDEGCNFPVVLAQKRLYAALLKKLAEQSASRQSIAEPVTHAEFISAICTSLSGLADAERVLARETTYAIDMIAQAGQLDEAFFQDANDQFLRRLRAMMNECWQANGMTLAEEDVETCRRRLYIALTTALLSKMRVRTEFVSEFGSIPRLLVAMAADHAEFAL